MNSVSTFFPQLKKKKKKPQDFVLFLQKEDDLSHHFKQFTQQTTYNFKAAVIAISQISLEGFSYRSGRSRNLPKTGFS